MNVDRQIQRQSKAPDRPIGVSTDAMPGRITGKFIKHEHRTALFGREFREPTHVQFEIGAFDELYFADRIRRFDENTQRIEWHSQPPLALGVSYLQKRFFASGSE